MFWTLLLAHFTADYPLQTDRMVVEKLRLPGLLLHIAVHLVTMNVYLFAVLGFDPAELWMLPVAVAAVHFVIDWGKGLFAKRYPQFIVVPYIMDQFLHYASLLTVAWWAFHTWDVPIFIAPEPWIIPATTVLVATYVTYITDKVFHLANPERLQRVNAQGWHRMVGRAAMLAGLWLGVLTPWGAMSLAVGFFFHWFDLEGRRLPELVFDFLIALIAFGFLKIFLP